MGYLAERVSYLRGLLDGLPIDKNSNECRLYDAMIELLDDMATSIEGLEEKQDAQGEEIGDMEEELGAIEDDLYGEDEPVEDDEPSDDDDPDDEGEEEPEKYCDEIECPNCGAVFSIDEDLLEGEDEINITCPECKEEITITFEDEEEDCGGDCEKCDEDPENCGK